MTSYRLLEAIAIGGVTVTLGFALYLEGFHSRVTAVHDIVKKLAKDIELLAGNLDKVADLVKRLENSVDSLAEDVYCLREFGMTDDKKSGTGPLG